MLDLTSAVREVRERGLTDLQQAAPVLAQVRGVGEIEELRQTFVEMTQRLGEQW